MRLFTGLALPDDVAGRLAAVTADCQPMARLRWSPPSNFHVTTKFIGEWSPERLAEITSALAFQHPPVPVRISGLGFFPNPRSPRIFWAGVDRSAELLTLATATASRLKPLGIAHEDREYSPHLTLARIPPGTSIDNLENFVAPLRSADFGEFTASEFLLFESKNSAYTRIATFPLR